MSNNIPQEILDFCNATCGELASFRPASGGCINNGGKIEAGKGTFFMKWNDSKSFPRMFTVESKGLSLLAETQCLQIPEVVEVYEGAHHSCIVMEYIESGPRTKTYWTDLARGLACLHKTSANQYGLKHNNYIGSLQQYNNHEDHWIDFFINNRLQPQVKLAMDHGRLNRSDLKKVSRFEKVIAGILNEEKPALVHGDLWSGNLMIGPLGNPVLIDPAVAYVHRETELAFTQLFGGFDREFYDAYQSIFPMESGYQERFDIYNVYPLLVHVNLFGGGYYQQAMSVVSRFS
ncbi:fructosamine kinase family protein [Fulvivirga sp. 29W222]|uniref:Fructosamine kinase family protein n=1 Tax=Fulvivirga marina TaxID=2494733 RepID=A0A937KB20_9BACT|nr:fructosamine kinase family protein [Fulvivirga marina]MBL6446311.1 fructosamine kinase family protein [Fulvivirga marina]